MFDPASVTVEDFKLWLREQDPETTYIYCDNEDCCFSRYLKARGVPAPWVASDVYYLNKPDIINHQFVGPSYPIPDTIGDAVNQLFGYCTYGNVLKALADA